MLGETEGHQDNRMVSGNQSTNSEISGRGRKRAVQPNRNYGDFVLHEESDSEMENRSNNNRQRGTQARSVARGGRGRKANGGDVARTTRANSDLRVNDNPGSSNINQNMSVESETDSEDLQIAEITEKMSEVKEHVVRNEAFSKAFLMAILRALPANVVDKFKEEARANMESEDYTWVQNSVAEMEPRNPSYAEVVETNSTETEAETPLNAEPDLQTPTQAR